VSRKTKFILILLAVVLTLTGCMQTVDKMYRLPKRSQDFQDLQKVIDTAMIGLEYSAPRSGENQQTVQMADLNGDGVQEYLLFAKSDTEHPLRILIFRQDDDAFVLAQTIESNGSAFDQVEYVQMDGIGGVELVFGSQLADQVLRSVSVYTFSEDLSGELLVSANYTKFLTVDLEQDGQADLFVLHPGPSDTDKGVAEVYSMENGAIVRSGEVNMSQPVDQLKRILVGKLHGGQTAVYVASSVEDTALITDVYAGVDGKLVNVSLSNESGTSIKTLRNYYVYADDLDNDGVVELPAVIPMVTVEEATHADRHDIIRWYAMTASGEEIDKQYTYHNFVGGWFVNLDSRWASQLMVLSQGSNYEFYFWDKDFTSPQRLVTIYVLTGQDREEQALEEGLCLLYKTDTVIYAAALEANSAAYGITQENIVQAFHLIQQDWKTGET